MRNYIKEACFYWLNKLQSRQSNQEQIRSSLGKTFITIGSRHSYCEWTPSLQGETLNSIGLTNNSAGTPIASGSETPKY